MNKSIRNNHTDDELLEEVISALLPYVKVIQPPGIVGADTLAKHNAKILAKAALSTIRNRPVKEGGDLVGAVELLGEITADYDNANDLSIIRHCGNYAMKAVEAIDLIKSHLKLRPHPAHSEGRISVPATQD